MGNTVVYTFDISKEDMKEYQKFIEKNLDSITVKCLKYLLENYKDKEADTIQSKISEIVNKEMEKKFVTDF